MATYELPNVTNGMDEALVGTVAAVPGLSVGILFFVFMVVLISGASSQKRRAGYVDFPMWILTASIPTLMLSLLFTLREGMIDITVLAVVVAINILSGLWFFLSKGKGEL